MTVLPMIALALAGQYTIHMPATAVPLGSPGLAELRVSPAATVPGLSHPGLVIELRTVGSTAEPALAFPNQRTIVAGERTIRIQTDAARPGPPNLTLRLLDLFPEKLMRPGRYALSFRIEGTNPMITVPPVSFAVTVPRESVALLFALLDAPQPSLRTAAAENLQRLTGQGFDWDPARPATTDTWKRWWEKPGRHMPWKDGVVYHLQPIPANLKSAILAGTLPPPSHARYLPDPAVTAVLVRRVEQDGPSEALWATMACMPDLAMAPLLRRFPDQPSARGLLQILTR